MIRCLRSIAIGLLYGGSAWLVVGLVVALVSRRLAATPSRPPV